MQADRYQPLEPFFEHEFGNGYSKPIDIALFEITRFAPSNEKAAQLKRAIEIIAEKIPSLGKVNLNPRKYVVGFEATPVDFKPADDVQDFTYLQGDSYKFQAIVDKLPGRVVDLIPKLSLEGHLKELGLWNFEGKKDRPSLEELTHIYPYESEFCALAYRELRRQGKKLGGGMAVYHADFFGTDGTDDCEVDVVVVANSAVIDTFVDNLTTPQYGFKQCAAA